MRHCSLITERAATEDRPWCCVLKIELYGRKRLRGLSGFGVPAGFAPAGVLAGVAAGFVPAGVVAGVVVGAAALPLPFPEFPTGDPTAGVVGGSDVSGVGSGGNGFDKTPATNWSIPSVLSPLRYLYHWTKLSFQPTFGLAKLGSAAASATARA